jgi:hypothetical protein
MKPQNILTSIALLIVLAASAFAQTGKTPSIQSVRDVDQPARQTFNKSSNFPTVQLGTVPEGKVLVIEMVTARVLTQAGFLGPAILQWHDVDKDEWYNHTIAPTMHNSTINLTLYTQPVKFYIPAGAAPTLSWYGDNSLIQFSSSVSGYYVDVPKP